MQCIKSKNKIGQKELKKYGSDIVLPLEPPPKTQPYDSFLYNFWIQRQRQRQRAKANACNIAAAVWLCVVCVYGDKTLKPMGDILPPNCLLPIAFPAICRPPP